MDLLVVQTYHKPSKTKAQKAQVR